MERERFLANVQLTQCATGLAEGPEIGGRLHCRNARKFLDQIVSDAGPVVLRMKQPINVVKQVFLGDRLSRISSAEL